MLEFQLKSTLKRGLSIPAQLKALREYAKSYSFRILEECVDESEAAKTVDRTVFKSMHAGISEVATKLRL